MEKIKEIWNNRKTRGIIFLILYVVLFSYIFIVYGKKTEKMILPDSKPTKVEKKVSLNYEYEYIVDDKIVNIKRTGKNYTFVLDNVEYYCLDGICYKLEEGKLYKVENPLKYNFDYLNKIDEIKKISELVKTAKYVDGRNEENYNVNMAQFLEIFNINEEVDAKTMTNYSIFLKDNNLDEIVFYDLNFKVKYISFDGIDEINVKYEIVETGEQ